MGLLDARAVLADVHRAEFEDVERLAAHARARLAEQYGATRVERDQCADDDEHRREQDQRRDRHAEIERALG